MSRFERKLCDARRTGSRCAATVRACAGMFLVLLLFASLVRAAEKQVPDKHAVTVPVRRLSSETTPETGMANSSATVPVPDVPQPTLPSGKLPQYDLSQVAAEMEDSVPNAPLRYRLVHGDESLLIEIVLQIDGEPYHEARETRVQRLMDELKASEAEITVTPVAAPTESTSAENSSELPLVAPLPAPAPAPVAATSPELSALRRYAQAIGREPTLDEVRWLLTHRIDGPTLLPLRQPFQAFRAEQRPVFTILDRNLDGSLSTEEIQSAVKSFQLCDLNRDDIVDVLEISKVAADPRARVEPPVSATELLVPVLESDEQGGIADVLVTVSFVTSDPGRSTISVSHASETSVAATNDSLTQRSNVIVWTRNALTVEFSAVQGPAMGDQISIGAVNDGYPLLPVLDLFDDGRFTIRELRTLVERLLVFDHNQDGLISADELKPTIRMAFGLGPLVHTELSGVRSIHAEDTRPRTVPPEWFVRMDRNQDRDLSRREFPGTDEQFQQLDSDGDGLVSAEEAVPKEAQKASEPEAAQASPATE